MGIRTTWAGSLAASICLSSAAASVAGIIQVIPGFQAVYPAGRFGGSSTAGIPAPFVKLPPAREYVLDYQVRFEQDFEWVKGGKLPGLVGGSHTSGCERVEPDGWSARFMWHERGQIDLYLYHQDRRSGCGDTYRPPQPAFFQKGRWGRITERVRVNAPGQADGSIEVWLDGRPAIHLPRVRLRGNVSETVALIDAVSLQTFYGGSSSSWAPPRATHTTFSAFHVRDSLPDLSLPFDERAGTGVWLRGPIPRPGLQSRSRGYRAATDATGIGNPCDVLGRPSGLPRS